MKFSWLCFDFTPPTGCRAEIARWIMPVDMWNTFSLSDQRN